MILHRLMHDESGQDLGEYAILLGLIALAVVTAIALVGGGIDDILTDIGGVLGRSV